MLYDAASLLYRQRDEINRTWLSHQREKKMTCDVDVSSLFTSFK